MKKSKLWFGRAVALLVLVIAGAGFGCSTPKMLSEDIEVLTVYKNEIATLKNPNLSTSGREKYEAALKLAKGVDFSLTRNVQTLDDLFLADDARMTHTDEFGDEIVFYYNYQDKFVRLRFWRAGGMVGASEVRVSN